jgi:hypothetical protein
MTSILSVLHTLDKHIECIEDTRCMCKEFREQAEGECHCGRYKKEK